MDNSGTAENAVFVYFIHQSTFRKRFTISQEKHYTQKKCVDWIANTGPCHLRGAKTLGPTHHSEYKVIKDSRRRCYLLSQTPRPTEKIKMVVEKICYSKVASGRIAAPIMQSGRFIHTAIARRLKIQSSKVLRWLYGWRNSQNFSILRASKNSEIAINSALTKAVIMLKSALVHLRSV